VTDHAFTAASLDDPPCGKSSRYLLPDMGSIPEFFLMELELKNLELKFATKEFNPQINLPFIFLNSEICFP